MNEYKLAHYVCAVCWGRLVERFRDGEWIIECAKYGAEHAGFVTGAYAENRRNLSRLEAAEVGSALATVLKLKRPSIEKARRALYGDGDGL